MADPTRTGAVLKSLDALGTQLAIDDFGTGYSSLAYLRSLPVRELKIDRSFVSRMATSPNDHAIVAATIDLGHTLGLRVVAEGVEDRATLRELTRCGCDLVQGYLLAKPNPVQDLRSWLAAWPGSTWTGDAGTARRRSRGHRPRHLPPSVRSRRIGEQRGTELPAPHPAGAISPPT